MVPLLSNCVVNLSIYTTILFCSAIDLSKKHLRNGYPHRKLRKDNTTVTNAALISSSRTSVFVIKSIEEDELEEVKKEEKLPTTHQPTTYYPTIESEDFEVPTNQPTYYPTIAWDGQMIEAPADGIENPYLFGSELLAVPELDIEVSSGLNVKIDC